MTIKTRQKAVRSRRVRLLLFLCLGVSVLTTGSAYPPAYAATATAADSRSAATPSSPLDGLSAMAVESLPSPSSLQDFTSHTISKLSTEAPFKEWKNAGTLYYPLGPGTHSWLVNVMDGDQRIGYLIIAAAQQGGGYVLSEYGAGTAGLPYSLTELRQYLVQEELIPSDYSGTMELTAVYAPLLPVWQLVLDDGTLYINATVPEVLPWSHSKADSVLNASGAETRQVSSLNQNWSPLQTYLSGGQDDPYADLQWMAIPKLKDVSGDSFPAAMLEYNGSVAFQSAGRNDTLGAPFMITGYQRWTLPEASGNSSGSSTAVVYAATGPGGKRYLPLAALQQIGTLHPAPLSGPAEIGAASGARTAAH